MRKVLTLIGVSAALIATGAVAQMGGRIFPRDQKIMDQWLGDKQAGDPVSCIPHRDIQSTYYIGGETILYKVSSNLVYRNDPPGGCPGLNSDLALETRHPTGMMCSGEIATVRDYTQSYSPGGCALGKFVPYRRVK